MSIKVNQLSKNFGDQKAVQSISFEIQEGEIVGFLGPNGAGKSTTLKMLIGQIEPDSGSATINDLDIAKSPIEIKKIIGYLAENNPMYKDMYVKEFLQFVGEIHGIPNKKLKNRITEVINLVGLQLSLIHI